MRAPCTVRASRPTSQYQDVTCNPGAPSRSGQYLLLRHVHTPDWQTVGLQQKHAALPGFVFTCFLFIFPYFLFFLLFFFAFSKTFLCKVNFDLFTKLFLVVGVCWLFQVGFSFLEEKKYSYIPSIWTFSSDSCLVGHISFGVHWEDLHFAAGIILKFITAIL